MPYKQIKTYGKVKKVNVIAEGESKYGNKMILAEVPFSLPHITAFVIYQWHPTYKEFRHFARFLADKTKKEEVEKAKKRAVEAFKKTAKNVKMYPDDEPEKGREMALMRMRGVAEPTTWLDVTVAYQKHYDLTKKALLKAVGGKVQRIKEYWASPFEAYYKIAITLNEPVKAVFRLKDNEYLEFNGQLIPLFINETAYTQYRLRLHKHFSERNLQKELEAKHKLELQIEEFYVQVDNPAWWSRLERRFVPRPCQIIFGIYK